MNVGSIDLIPRTLFHGRGTVSCLPMNVYLSHNTALLFWRAWSAAAAIPLCVFHDLGVADASLFPAILFPTSEVLRNEAVLSRDVRTILEDALQSLAGADPVRPADAGSVASPDGSAASAAAVGGTLPANYRRGVGAEGGCSLSGSSAAAHHGRKGSWHAELQRSHTPSLGRRFSSASFHQSSSGRVRLLSRARLRSNGLFVDARRALGGRLRVVWLLSAGGGARRCPRAPSSFVTAAPYGFCRPCKGSGGREGGPIGGEAGACQVGVSHGDRGIHHCVLPVFPGRAGLENASSERTGRIVRPREDGHGIEPRGVRLALAR